jgi:signal transduction histidine kinase
VRSRASLRRRVRSTFILALVAAVAMSALGTLAFRGLLDARRDLVDRADPALVASERLLAALVDQETGIRGYVISGDRASLEPSTRGEEAATDQRAVLARLGSDLDVIPGPLARVDAAVARWDGEYVQPTLEALGAGQRPQVDTDAALAAGRTRFDAVRAAVTDLQRDLEHERASAKDDLTDSTTRLIVALLIGAAVLVGIVGALWRLVRRDVERPLVALGDDARAVSAGDLSHAVEPVGPDEIYAMGEAMEGMRLRILRDLESMIEARDQLEQQSEDLARSNAELEQFAYVASHDLQEPLRKVASFCQLLQSRYGGQLDERADQYIEFAVDGAKRMQALINDLLAFSRVGRIPTDEVAVVAAGSLAARAVENLAAAIEETGAVVDVADLPDVRVEPSLGVALFQNLIGNGLKFHRVDVAPEVHVTFAAQDGFHEFAVRDNGIGIEPEYADRVFVIFQRLHTKEAYAGTGIGLALCRKIVEHHGGRIWVDPGTDEGTTIRFTLPSPSPTTQGAP